MIASLSGTLAVKSPQEVVINVQGVGYHVSIALSTYFVLPNLEEPIHLFISTHIRNDTIQLFGFRTTEEKNAFSLLTGISGIGPKLALSGLSALSIPELCTAIETGDTDTLSTIPGVGKKSASRIILELKDKTHRIRDSDVQKPSMAFVPTGNYLEEEASSALLNLGYRAQEVSKAIKHAITKLGETYELEDLIRTTLKELAKG